MNNPYPKPETLPLSDEIPELPDPQGPSAASFEAAASGAVGGAAAQRPSSRASAIPLYHLEIICANCEVHARVNDVPLLDLRPARLDELEHFAPPINLYLIATLNELVVELAPLSEDEDPRAGLANAHVELAVARFARHDAVAPGSGERVLEALLDAELADRIAASLERVPDELDPAFDSPQRFVHRFTTEGPSFDEQLVAAAPLHDDSHARRYALELRDLARAGDVEALLDHMAPKIAAYARAYAYPASQLHDSLAEGLNGMIRRGLELEFEAEEVELRPAAGGRLLALERPGARPLLQSLPDEAGGTVQIDVWVGNHEGALRILR